MGALIDEYREMTASGNKFSLLKGQLNKLKLRPQIINEHAESSREAMDIVESGVIVGQIFKASQDNINGIGLTLESAEGSTLDDFEGYAASGNLQAAWILAGSNEATLETTIVKTGDKSMKLNLSTLNDEWAFTVGDSIDYTDFTFNLDWYQDRAFAQAKVSFFVEDGSSASASIQLTIGNINTWEHFEININALSDDAGAVDLTDIDKIGFRVDDAANTFSGYVDDIVATPPPGQVEIKLWDMGTTLPVGDGATFSLDDATQYAEIGDRGANGGAVTTSYLLDLVGGKKLYMIRAFIAGVALEIPDNNPLNEGHYYALTLHYIDTDVTVYGPDTTFSISYYNNGYAFSTPGEASANHITKIPGAAGSGDFSDLMFMVFSTQDVFVLDIGQIADATPGSDAGIIILAEDKNMKVTTIAVSGVQAQPLTSVDLSMRPSFLEKGSKLEIYYNDDFTDSVTNINFGFRYFFVPPTVNG
jgi:hypothetical protein